jgi:hypothetical protein
VLFILLMSRHWQRPELFDTEHRSAATRRIIDALQRRPVPFWERIQRAEDQDVGRMITALQRAYRWSGVPGSQMIFDSSPDTALARETRAHIPARLSVYG